MGFDQNNSSGLGSLAQSARGKQLNQARWILIIIGGLSTLLYGFLFLNAETKVNELFAAEIKKQGLDERFLDQAKIKEGKEKALGIWQMINGAFLAAGVAMIVCGVLVKTYPVPCTVGGLVIYV